jgi:hypothetical protein
MDDSDEDVPLASMRKKHTAKASNNGGDSGSSAKARSKPVTYKEDSSGEDEFDEAPKKSKAKPSSSDAKSKQDKVKSKPKKEKDSGGSKHKEAKNGDKGKKRKHHDRCASC